MKKAGGGVMASMAWKWGVVFAVAVSALINLYAIANWRPALDPVRAGTLGVGLGPQDAQRRSVITALPPGSPIERAGGKIGDLVQLDRLTDTADWRPLDVQERIGLTVHTQAGAKRLVIQPVPKPGFEPASAVMSWITGWGYRFIALSMALLLALRRSDSPPMRGLMVALLGINAFGWYFLPGGALREQVGLWIEPLAALSWNLGFLYFALRYGVAILWSRAIVRRGFGLLVVASIASSLTWVLFALGVAIDPEDADYVRWRYVVRMLCRLLSITALLWTWRYARGVERERIAWVAWSMGLGWMVFVMYDVAITFELHVPQIYLYFDLTTCLSFIGLAYATVRHRVFDIGFAVNRALVFSIVSAIVLVAFGIAEWGAKKLLKLAGTESNLAIDAAVALAVFLVFHRIHHWVSHRVNHTFYRQWEDAAERLRAFAERAPHVTEASELRAKLVAALADYSDAGAALYGRGADGFVRLAASDAFDAPTQIAENDDAVVELRRSHSAVILDDLHVPSAVAGHALMLPTTLRGQVAGFVLVGHKPQQQLFRPDELSLLARSVQSVGLDLESLRVEALERDNAAMVESALRLRAELGEARLAAARAAGAVAP